MYNNVHVLHVRKKQKNWCFFTFGGKIEGFLKSQLTQLVPTRALMLVCMAHAMMTVALLLTMIGTTLTATGPFFSSSPDEFYSLHTLYTSTNGIEWEPSCRENWNFTCLDPTIIDAVCPDPCSSLKPWFGISCYGSNVSSIALSGCKLSGALPPTALKFPGMTTLVIDSNNITSTLPVLTELPFLFQLSAAHNQFTGPVPALPTTLFSVYLRDNLLTGEEISSVPVYLIFLYACTMLCCR